MQNKVPCTIDTSVMAEDHVGTVTSANVYCVYYQAHVVRSQVWFFAAILRSFDHVAFDRTYDVAQSIFEFFVPEAMEPYFLEIVNVLYKEGVVLDVKKSSNRLRDAHQLV